MKVGIYISPLVAQFLSHPFGVIMAKVLPRHRLHLFGYGFSFNP